MQKLLMMNAPPETASTLQDALQRAALRLRQAGIENSRFEAGVLLAYILGVSREHVLLHAAQFLADSEEAQFMALVERRCHREPMAYLTGHREFWSLEFAVNPHVLIPRPETEGIIEQLIRIAGDAASEKELSILDLGTGSGILAVTAAVEFPRARVTATDVSADALSVARGNARHHGVANRMEFLQRDMMGDDGWPQPAGYDFILSNPPYIPTADLDGLMPDIRDYEPPGALDGGPDGLIFYRNMIPRVLEGLKPGGSLILEVGDGQAGAVADLIEGQTGFDKIAIHQDLSGTGRIVSARRAYG